MNPAFTFLRIERPGPGGTLVSECSLLDDSGLPGDRVLLSSFLVEMRAAQADRLEEFFRTAGVKIQRKAEAPEKWQRRETKGARPAPEKVHAGNPASLFPAETGSES